MPINLADENGNRLPVWRAWAQSNYYAKKPPDQAPKNEAGRLFAAKVWDRLADAYGQPISPALRDAFLAALNAGEAETAPAPGPLAADVSQVLRRAG